MSPPIRFRPPEHEVQAVNDRVTGAYHDALQVDAGTLKTGLPGYGVTALLNFVIQDQIGEHDLAAAGSHCRGLAAQRRRRGPFRPADRHFLPGRRLDPRLVRPAATLRRPISRPIRMTVISHLLPMPGGWLLPKLRTWAISTTAEQSRLSLVPPADCYPCLIARAPDRRIARPARTCRILVHPRHRSRTIAARPSAAAPRRNSGALEVVASPTKPSPASPSRPRRRRTSRMRLEGWGPKR